MSQTPSFNDRVEHTTTNGPTYIQNFTYFFAVAHKPVLILPVKNVE
jgi:hypothetical protein